MSFEPRGSFSDRLYHEPLRIVVPRSDATTSATIPGQYGAVDRNPGSPRRRVWWPEDPASPGEPLETPGLFVMGPADGLELIAAGVSKSPDDEMRIIVTRIDPIVGPAGVAGFLERVVVDATGVRTSIAGHAFAFANDAASNLPDVEVGDDPFVGWTFSGEGGSSYGDTGTCSALEAFAEQAAFMRVYCELGDVSARWVYGHRVQRDAVPVWR